MALSGLHGQTAVCISAKTGQGIDEFLATLEDMVNRLSKTAKFLFPFDMQSAVSTLYRRATVLSCEYTDGGTEIVANVDSELYGKYQEYIVE
jgi:GTP-binding protein HflX